MEGSGPVGHGVVVVGLDGSPASVEALRRAATEARLGGAPLRVVSAWQPGAESWPTSLRSPGDRGLETRLLQRRIVLEVLGACPDVEVTMLALEGPAAEVLVEAARDASVLVLGDRGRGDFAGMRLGSVGLHCLEHATCPVMIVRTRCPYRVAPLALAR